MKKLITIIIIAFFSLSAVNVSADEVKETIPCKLLMEAETGTVISEENGYKTVPQGTLSKLMTVLLTAEEIADGKISLDTMLTASANANTQNGAVVWLMSGEKISVDELLKSVIIGNANDASVVLAEKIGGDEKEFVGMMNARAFELGMRNTVFKNPCGYDCEGQYSTAYDMALLTREILKHEFLKEYMTTWIDSVRNDQTELVNENILVRTYNGIIGAKAGHSEMSGYTLSLAVEREGQTYIAIVLGCDDENERFSIGKNLIGLGFSSYKVTSPAFSNEFLKPVEVKHGADSAVEIMAKDLKLLVVPKNGEELTSAIFLPEYVEAPIKKGQKLGIIGFYNGDTLLYESELIACNNVEEVDFAKAFSKYMSILYKK